MSMLHKIDNIFPGMPDMSVAAGNHGTERPDQPVSAVAATDTVKLSDEAKSLRAENTQGEEKPNKSLQAEELSEEEKKEVKELKDTDREVHTHEQAHVSAGGGLTGAPSYQYKRGPDNNQYAVAGSVQIDTSPGNSPEETITKAQRIKAAALAPAEPSGADRQVAAAAERMETEAHREKTEKQGEDNGAGKIPLKSENTSENQKGQNISVIA